MNKIKKIQCAVFLALLFLFPKVLFAQQETEVVLQASTLPDPAGDVTSDQSGSSNESFEADYFTGAATNRINLDLPPGRAGMQPKILLSYDSHRRELGSIVGFGWELNPGYIERSAAKGIDYQGSDFVFAADGVRKTLVQNPATPVNGCREYNAKIETGDFVRYFNCGDHWQAYDKEGRKYLFGSSFEARLSNSDESKVFRWYLKEIVDLNENTIKYDYAKDSVIGELRSLVLIGIRYTGHSAGSGYPFQIQFEYSSFDNSNIYKPQRFETVNHDFLTSINIINKGVTVRTYNLGYEAAAPSGTVLLKSLQLTTSDGASTVSLPPRTFEYSNLAGSLYLWGTYTETHLAIADDDLGIYNDERGFFDLNGDGYIDRVVGRPGQHKFDVYRGSANGFSQTSDVWDEPVNIAGLDGKISGQVAGYYSRIIDMNGDMLPDRIYSGRNFILSDGSRLSGFVVAYNRGSSWNAVGFIADPLCNDVLAFCAVISDRDLLMDITGDGLPDRVYVDANTHSFRVYKNLGGAFASVVEIWTDPTAQWGVPGYFRDMNGDHLPDRVMPYAGRYIKVYLGNGHGWDVAASFDMDDPAGRSTIDETTELIDVNNDGLADRIVSADYSNKIHIYFNTGQNFDTQHHLEVYDPVSMPMTGKISYGSYPGLIDINGDGFLDRIVPAIRGEADVSYFRPYSGQSLYLLKKMDNGLGVKTEIEYTPASRFDNRLLPLPLFVVTKISLKEGSEEKNTYIRYAGGYYYPDFHNPFGRKFDGFQFVEITGPLGNVRQQWYRQAWDSVVVGRLFVVPDHVPSQTDPIPLDSIGGMPEINGEVAGSGRLYQETVYYNPNSGGAFQKHHETYNRWQVADLNNSRKFIYLLSKERKEFYGAAPKVLKQDWTYDEGTGNLTSETDFGEPAVDIIHKTTFSDFFVISTPDVGSLVTNKAKTVEAKEADVIKNRTTRGFDPKGNMLKLTRMLLDTRGQRDIATSYTYDAFGNILTVTDALQRVTRYEYETDFNTYPKFEKINVSGSNFITEREYNGVFGKPTKTITPDGRTWQTKYDPLGRITEKSLNQSWAERYVYENILARPGTSGMYLTATKKFTYVTGDSDSAVLPRGVTYRDGQGRVLLKTARSERTSNEYRVWNFAYREEFAINVRYEYIPRFETSGNFVEASGYYTAYAYDSLGRLKIKTPPTGETNSPTAPTRIVYGYLGNPWITVYTDELGKDKRETRNGRGQVVNVTDVVSGRDVVTSYYYDFWGNRIRTEDSRWRVNETIFDNLGRKITENDLDRGSWSYTYDDVGNLLTQTDARGITTTFTYDAINRVKTKTATGPSFQTEATVYTYDTPTTGNNVRKGELSEITDNNGYTRFSYNNWGGVERVERTIAGLSGVAKTEYKREIDGRVLEMKYPGNKVHIKYDYDKAGQVSKVTRLGTQNEEMYRIGDGAYDSNGHLTKATYGNNVQENYTYFSGGKRLSGIVDHNVIGTQPETIREISYSYNASGDVTSINDGLNTNAGLQNGELTNITYDDLHRVTGYKYYQGATTGQSSESYTYDNFGNLKTNSESFGPAQYNYNVANHALSGIGNETFTYDANGNMTHGRSRTLIYSASNQLKAVTLDSNEKVEYGYGGLGERLYKKLIPRNASETAITYYFGNYLEITDGSLVHNIYVNNKLIAQIGDGKWNDGISKTGRGWERDRIIAQNFVYCPTLALMGIAAIAIPFARRTRNGRRVILRVPVVILNLFQDLGAQGMPKRVRHDNNGLSSNNPQSSSATGLSSRTCFGIPIVPAILRAPVVILNLFQDLAVTVAANMVETFIQLGLDTRRKIVAATIIVTLLTPATAFGYTFPTDVEDTWPADDGSFMVYVHLDHLKSSSLYTEGKAKGRHNGIRFVKGEIVQRIEYTPFGKERFVLNPTLREGPKFTDQLYDLEDGLYFYQSRYYDAVIGRFIQPDNLPSELLFQNTGSQELNRYSYAINNPLKFTDPTGNYIDPENRGNTSSDEKTRSEQINKMMQEADAFLERFKKNVENKLNNLGGTGTTAEGNTAANNSVTDNPAQQNQNVASEPSSYWEYSQSTGNLTYVSNGVRTLVTTGYSGGGLGLNNPEMQAVRDIGPIPQGVYNIGTGRDTRKGTNTMRLDPRENTEMLGRSGFLIHADNLRGDQSASAGCVILDRATRERIARSAVHELRVTP